MTLSPGPRPCQARTCHSAATKLVELKNWSRRLCHFHYQEEYEGRFFGGTITDIDLSGTGEIATATQRNTKPDQKETT